MKKNKGQGILFISLLLLYSFFPLYSQYKYKPFYTYYNFCYGAKSLSMGNAFVAVADDLTTVFSNPAGIGYFQFPQFYFNYRTDNLRHDYQSHDCDFQSKLKNVNFISIYAPAYFWDMKLNFALSYYRYIPYGFAGYSQEVLSPGNGSADSEETTTNFSGKNGIDVLGFSAALFLLKQFSFGITLQQFFNTGTRVYDFVSPGSSVSEEYNEKLEGRNLIFGILFTPLTDVNIGCAYHTPLSGTFQSEDTARIYIPAQFSLGISARLIQYLNISYEFSKILWSKGKIDDLPFPVHGDFSLVQQDILNHRLGIEGNIPLKKVRIYLRTGLSWERQLFTGADASRARLRAYAFGAGIQLLPGIALDLAYMHQSALWPEPGCVDPSTIVNTTLKNDIFTLALTYRFLPPRRRPGPMPIPQR